MSSLSVVNPSCEESGGGPYVQTPFERVLGSGVRLDPDDLQIIRSAVTRSRTHPAASPIKLSDRSSYAVLLSGWVGCGRLLPDGRRQFVSVFIPGDILSPVPLPADEVEYFALTKATTFDAVSLLDEIKAAGECNLAAAWNQALDYALACLIRQVIRLGALSAYERTACFFLELYERQLRAGLMNGQEMSLPISQEILADILGSTPVHINRVVQSLRRDGILALNRGRATIISLSRIARASRRA